MQIAPSTVRYIKLGRGGSWEEASLDRGELHFGYRDTPHELALTGDPEKIRDYLIENGKNPRAASREAQEVSEFYTLGPDCLWITFARGHLWWAFARPEVTWLGGDGKTEGERIRKTVDGWHNTDVNGQPLQFNSLSTRLTKVSGYRRTLCGVEAEDYLRRRINGTEEPISAKAAQARESFLNVVTEALKSLHWSDFETLVDIIFARNGWNRISALGGTQRDFDLELEQPSTNERAAVQVKSAATQRTLDDYIERVTLAGRYDRFFFVCHSPKGNLAAPADRSDVHIWTGADLASTVLKTGLHDWVLEKIDARPANGTA